MRKILVGLVLGVAVTAAAAFAGWNYLQGVRSEQVAELIEQATSTKLQLLGFTKYSDYLSAGQQTLVEQTKLLTASVKRSYRLAREVKVGALGVAVSKGAIVVEYDVDYSFGYELKPSAFQVRDTGQGIELQLPRPTLVAPPAVSGLHQHVVAGGFFTDEKSAALGAYEEAASNAQRVGAEMAKQSEVVALCEKSVISFFRDFLAKQPGVKSVPSISIVYRD